MAVTTLDEILITPSNDDWTSTDAWETLYLGGKRIVGVATVDVKLGGNLDIQKPKGGKKARIRDNGDPPAEVDITIELLSTEVKEFESQIDIIRPRAYDRAHDPIEIGHPNARLWDINVVTIGQISSPQPGPGGALKIKITAHEWHPEPKEVKKAKEKPEDGDTPEHMAKELLGKADPPSTSGAGPAFFTPADFKAVGFGPE
jgi:hypothetical protein